jgi:FKBP-type peptidyl-prolyl cis-trans isomerase
MTRSFLIAAAALCCLAAVPAKTHAPRAAHAASKKTAAAATTHVPPDTPAGPDFLKRNGAARGVVTTSSGLEYFAVVSGPKSGAHPTAADTVTLDYELKLPNGDVLDSSYARGEPLTGQAGDFVPGFTEALKLMRPGDEWIVWIPPQLGYGAEGKGPIPGNSVLRFRLALHSIAPAS